MKSRSLGRKLRKEVAMGSQEAEQLGTVSYEQTVGRAWVC